MAQVEIIAANLKNNIKDSVKKIIKRVCAYCRVSIDSEEQQTSYNSQIKYYTEKIKSNPDWEFVGIYADEGIRVIARKLNDLNIPSCKGTKWCQSAVRRIISQEKYCGDLIQQKYYTTDPLTHHQLKNKAEKEKYYIQDHHRSIVSREVWNQASDIAEKRLKKFTDINRPYIGQYKMMYPFSNKLECCSCHQPFVKRTGKKKKDGTQNIYWACTSRNESRDLCSNSKCLRDDILEEIFVQIYNTIIANKHKINF